MFQTTRLSKAISALLIASYAVYYFVPDTSSYLALVPGRTLPCVWNLVTAGFWVANPIELAINVVALLLLARLVEPVYGSKEFLKFLFVVDLLVCCTVFVVVYISYAISASGQLLYTEFSGFHGLIAALLVAVKQIMPHHELKLAGTFKLRVKYLPSLVLIPVVGVCLGLGYKQFLSFYLSGTYLSWLYLRFFQQQPDSPLYGDASDDFKFSSFFPEFLETPIDLVAGLLGFCTRLRHAPGAEGTGPKQVSLGGPSVLGTDSADANRRRERGAKALEERLGMKQAGAGHREHAGSGDVEAGAGEGGQQ
mmetsp:Transcript_36298/g.91666  ORF Transcript_36298/g.91666 Transcript_36298/m.91666 type:complete len:308 (-) Transcript_36298:710-1633(-)|eukprot:CAMPEP_0202878836 /NCGR_PEP_ID=MMETSP1391-20130828/32791_1 /ASSEMBLY_ACC=CAM_ASM_000867 /TAXON_ID=1034604 /ORGANISM="Chlamydomonas leiostraca, Strain SAG 11-49" /LENGTH=307 /DNA_ID=CAMNT_0049561099 /DNA_START=110 /DNA_END=1033 /DNA_ORIENTATION=+